MLVSYVYQNGQRIGCVVAVGPKLVGWSVCNRKDRFNKKLGRDIAYGRATNGSVSSPPTWCVSEIMDAYIRMFDRSVRYFKPL